MGMKPSAPISIDTSLFDQASRYGMGINDYLYGSNNTYTAGSELPDTVQKGNPFFTGTNQPILARTKTQGINRPFTWSGNNKSLRKQYQKSIDSYRADNPVVNFEQQATWQGPQIRPEYQMQSNGLSQLGTPSYWQDNNKNDVFDLELDDSFEANQDQPMSMGQVDSMTAPTAPQEAGGNDSYDFANTSPEAILQAFQRRMFG